MVAMRQNIYLFSIAHVFALLPSLSWGECLYCDSWRAIDGNPYFFESTIKLSRSSVTFPSCKEIKYKQVKSIPSSDYGEVCTDHFFELVAVPKCKGIEKKFLKPFVLVTACPRTPWGNEELRVDMRQQPMHPKNAASDFFGASWRLIRKSYDPCGSGGGHGQYLCAKFQREEAEEHLLALLKGQDKSGFREWAQARDRECSVEGDGLSESWSYASEEQCKLGKTWDRTSELQQQKRSETR